MKQNQANQIPVSIPHPTRKLPRSAQLFWALWWTAQNHEQRQISMDGFGKYLDLKRGTFSDWINAVMELTQIEALLCAAERLPENVLPELVKKFRREGAKRPAEMCLVWRPGVWASASRMRLFCFEHLAAENQITR